MHDMTQVRRRQQAPDIALRRKAGEVVRSIDRFVLPWRSRLAQLDAMRSLGRFGAAERDAARLLSSEIEQCRQNLTQSLSGLPAGIAGHEIIARRVAAVEELSRSAAVLQGPQPTSGP